jgi:hypothetical protein
MDENFLRGSVNEECTGDIHIKTSNVTSHKQQGSYAFSLQCNPGYVPSALH